MQTTPTPITYAHQFPAEAAAIDQLLTELDTLCLVELLAERLRNYANQPGNSLAHCDADILDRAAAAILAEAN